MSTVVATRELKSRLGRYLRLVRRGGTVVVTDRGRPVAEIRPVEAERAGEEAVLESLASRGVVSLPTRAASPSWRPVPVAGPSFSQTVLDLREDSP